MKMWVQAYVFMPYSVYTCSKSGDKRCAELLNYKDITTQTAVVSFPSFPQASSRFTPVTLLLSQIARCSSSYYHEKQRWI